MGGGPAGLGDLWAPPLSTAYGPQPGVLGLDMRPPARPPVLPAPLPARPPACPCRPYRPPARLTGRYVVGPGIRVRGGACGTRISGGARGAGTGWGVGYGLVCWTSILLFLRSFQLLAGRNVAVDREFCAYFVYEGLSPNGYSITN